MHGINSFKEMLWGMFGTETNWQDGENYVIGSYKVCTLNRLVGRFHPFIGHKGP